MNRIDISEMQDSGLACVATRDLGVAKTRVAWVLLAQIFGDRCSHRRIEHSGYDRRFYRDIKLARSPIPASTNWRPVCGNRWRSASGRRRLDLDESSVGWRHEDLVG
jgi:hypothetical protein